MAIAPCPNCGKKISSHAAICSYCGFEQGEATAQDLEVFRMRRLRDRIYRLNMISYLVITLFVAGFGWYWWESRGFLQRPSGGSLALMGLAAIAYVLVRAMLFRSRQLYRQMRQKTGPE